MAINANEQGGIEYKHSKAKVKAETEMNKKMVNKADPDKISKPTAPVESQQAIKNGGVPVQSASRKREAERVAKVEAEEKARQAEIEVNKPAVPEPVESTLRTGEKSLNITDQGACKENVTDVEIFGEDLSRLMSKASSKKEGWMKSTKAFDTGRGCLVQVTTPQRNIDGTYAIAEALTFVPGAKIKELKGPDGIVTGRTFIGAS